MENVSLAMYIVDLTNGFSGIVTRRGTQSRRTNTKMPQCSYTKYKQCWWTGL